MSNTAYFQHYNIQGQTRAKYRIYGIGRKQISHFQYSGSSSDRHGACVFDRRSVQVYSTGETLQALAINRVTTQLPTSHLSPCTLPEKHVF